MRWKWIVILGIFSGNLMAEDVVIVRGEIVTIGVHEVDTIIDLPRPLRLIPETKSYLIEGVEENFDQDGNPVDIRSVRIRRRGVNPAVEIVPLLLAGGLSIDVKLIAINADRYYKLIIPKQSIETQDVEHFLGRELALMRLMLRDEEGQGYVKKIQKSELVIEGLPDIKVELIRRYNSGSSDLLGYVFKLTNTTNEEILLLPQEIGFVGSNKTVAIQSDRSTLKPCSGDSSCVTAVRLVVRGEGWDLPVSKNAIPWQIMRAKQ